MLSVAFYFAFVDLAKFKARFGVDFEEYFKEEIAFLKERGLIEMQDGKMVVTEDGVEQVGGVIPMFYSNESREELMKIKKLF